MAGAYLTLTLDDNAFYVALWSESGSKNFKGFAVFFLIVAMVHVIQILRIVYLSIRSKRLVLHNECCKATYSNDEATKIRRFDVFFAIREMVLVGSLSYQAYQSSYLVPREGLNNLNAAFLILACWVTPLAQVLLRQSTALSRVVPLFSSFVLCTFLAKAVHGILVKSYTYMFDIDHAVFAAKMIYDPTFVSILVPENRMMFATTSRHKVAPLGCFRVTHPWFTSNVSCLGLVYDCAIQGTPSPTNEAFDTMKLESKTLGSLSFTHCPALIVPSAIQSFPNIYSVHIFNSTLYSWGSSAALVEDHHHHLVSVVLIYVKLAAFPEGLMSKLPPTLVNLQFFATSLPSVPSDLGTRWGVGRNPISRVGFEYGMLTTIPAETFQLPVKSLSLAGNYLYAIPQLSAVAAKTYLPQLILDGNPVLTLPATVDPTFMIGNLCIEGSKLSTLPSWTQTQVLSKMFLYESAFCFNTTAAQQEANNSICSVSHWGSTKPKSPIVLMQEVYG
ncbi:hypothetical protein BBJ29_004477 [Phytophthora kernoviae]|uniref:Uncharacterized protein n=1 Tax=Phytophthora kernoviae TaxID=325452 RepID=A0A3F2RJI3_9STRA|nr:hypothetical protein BBP00_00006952 [Phytophthora kernoviae]RLN70430.1 hypothetical protein BBJ29_004477 [Phytophthora kernoviae]